MNKNIIKNSASPCVRGAIVSIITVSCLVQEMLQSIRRVGVKYVWK